MTELETKKSNHGAHEKSKAAEREALSRKMWAEGKTVREISAVVGVSQSSVRRYLDLKPKRPRMGKVIDNTKCPDWPKIAQDLQSVFGVVEGNTRLMLYWAGKNPGNTSTRDAGLRARGGVSGSKRTRWITE